MTDLLCWNCGAALGDVPVPVSRHADCPRCRTEVRCCRMCRYYDARAAAGQCTEDRADPPSNKETANFCEWFALAAGRHAERGDDRQDSARARLDALFGGGDD